MDDILKSTGRFEEAGIRFVLAEPKDLDRVWKFFCEEFVPDEPCMRSVGLDSDKTWIDRLARADLKKVLAKSCLNNKERSFSILALDADGDVVGIKLGYFVKATDKAHRMHGYSPAMRRFYWAMPRKLINFNQLAKYLEKELRYHPTLALKDLDSESMFEGEVLGVGKKARGMGLGKEMLRMSIEIAKMQRCDVYFSCVSGIYSQKIYKDMGFTVLKELIYEDVKDEKGRQLLNDTREHKKAQNVYLRL